MATAAICGYDGSVSGVTGVTEVTQWTISRTVDANDATSMDSIGWKEFIACLKGGSGSFTSIGHEAAVGSYTATFKTKSSGGATISGAIIVQKCSVESSVAGIVTYNHDFVFTGAVGIS